MLVNIETIDQKFLGNYRTEDVQLLTLRLVSTETEVTEAVVPHANREVG